MCCRFEEAKKKITMKYDEIERALIEEFVVAHRKYDVGRMREIAAILSHFKNYSQCVDAFIEHSQSVIFNLTIPSQFIGNSISFIKIIVVYLILLLCILT